MDLSGCETCQTTLEIYRLHHHRPQRWVRVVVAVVAAAEQLDRIMQTTTIIVNIHQYYFNLVAVASCAHRAILFHMESWKLYIYFVRFYLILHLVHFLLNFVWNCSGSRFPQAEFRYGREEMLSLHDKSFKLPELLPKFHKLFIEKMQCPLALLPPSSDEVEVVRDEAVFYIYIFFPIFLFALILYRLIFICLFLFRIVSCSLVD